MGLLFLILPAAPRQQLVSGSTLNSGSTRRLELLGQSSADILKGIGCRKTKGIACRACNATLAEKNN